MKAQHAMLGPEARNAFRHRLLRWFEVNRRDLPWRADRDPYHVWLSEIMLQQTRVAVVRERYPLFLARFPDVEHLASARLSQVLATWSGLGYYRRARALHAAARQLVSKGGGFPRTAGGLKALPGVGRYTAAAIASIAFEQPCAVVDGNVERVLGRIFGLHKRDAWHVAEELLSPRRPGDFNQAMMELGATVCLPQAPLCAGCPLFAWCETRGRSPSRVRSRRRKSRISYRLSIRNRSVFLVRRGKQESVMPGMWELPSVRASAKKPDMRLKHAITNTDYQVRVFRADNVNGTQGRWVKLGDLEWLPLTGLTQKILRRSMLI
jgi:A/G-specific adenine glycosylase